MIPQEKEHQRDSFTTSLGVLAATLGSAVGLVTYGSFGPYR